MAKPDTIYGILKDSTNTGLAGEIDIKFVAPLSVHSNQPSLYADTVSLRRVIVDSGAQRWEIETNLEPGSGARVMAQQLGVGHHTPFLIRMPQPYSPVAQLSAQEEDQTVLMSATAFVGDRTIYTNNPMLTGEFLRFATSNHTKVYVVTKAALGSLPGSSPPVAAWRVDIAPALSRTEQSGNTVFRGGKVTGTFRYDLDVVLGMRYVDGVLSDPGSVRLVEAI